MDDSQASEESLQRHHQPVNETTTTARRTSRRISNHDQIFTPAAAVVPSVMASDDDDDDDEESLLISRAQRLMDKVTFSADNPSPCVLHALSSILETQEARYMEETGHSSSTNNLRASHNVGHLGNLLRDNDEFFDLISAKYLRDTARYPISIQAPAARLLLSCSLTWTYPHHFEDSVLDQIKARVMDDNAKLSALDCSHRKHHNGKHKSSSDSEMLITYATGLLAVALNGGGHLVEDVLTSGLPAKLMRYLRSRVLGETTSSQKDAKCLLDKNMSTTGSKSREDSRGRFRHILGATHLAGPIVKEDGTLDDQCVQIDQDRSIRIEAPDETCWNDGREPPNCSAQEVDINDIDADDDEKWRGREIGDAKIKLGDTEESGKEDISRRRVNRGWARYKGKTRISEGAADNEMSLTSPGSGSQFVQGRSYKDRNLDMKRVLDAKKSSGRVNGNSSIIVERGENDECFQGCIVGSKDFSDLAKKAVRAAEDEARSANAPSEAIKAAGDAAAEVVKSAALEEFRSTGNEEAAVMAASRAASTVIDAAIAVEAARRSSVMNVDLMNGRATEPADIKEETEEYFIPDTESLAKLREKFCIQCLEILGEYVEVLGPVLHEKGVDVSLALLQRSSKEEEASKEAVLLPDILKLICALAAHRKFAALFVDRGGMQKLLSIPRISQTFFGLSSCLFTIGSLQGIMERVCALPSEIVQKIVELALQLLECPQDQARRNAALFFNAAFVFRAILDCFNAQDGLQKLLSLLNEAASVRSGVNLGASALSGSGSLRNDRLHAEVLTSAEKQIAYHTCVALRQYFRAHLLLLVDSIRPNKNNRGVARNVPSLRAPYKPLDISNEAMDAVFLQLQKDRKLGPAFVRTRWPEVDKFLSSNGHIIMLELCQAPPGERYLHDLLQYALGVLHIVTLMPYSRKLIVNATLSNDRVGIAVILDAATCGSYVEPEIIQPALNVLVNLVCPPPSISNKTFLLPQVQQSASVQAICGTTTETRDKNVERNVSDRAVSMASQSEPRERNVEPYVVDCSNTAVLGTSSNGGSSHTPVPPVASGLVGDRRICLGAGTGCAGLAAQLEQGFRQAREAVRSNNGIKVLLHLLQPRVGTPPFAVDCLRALACRALLGLARDDTIAHILTKLQVGKKLSELIRDPGSQTHGTEQDRWQAELAQAAIELISIVTNSGRASTLAATDAAIPTLRRIERAAIAAATPITYHSRELLLLVHEHLQMSGLATTAATLLKEAQLTPLPSLAAPSSLAHQVAVQESPSLHMQWPCGRSSFDFLFDKSKCIVRDEDSHFRGDSAMPSSKKKPLVFSSSLKFHSKNQLQPLDSIQTSNGKGLNSSKKTSTVMNVLESPTASMLKPDLETESQLKTPVVSPLKRKLTGLKDAGVAPSGKRLHNDEHGFCSPTFPSPNTTRKTSLFNDVIGFSTPCTIRDHYGRSTPCGVQADNINDNKYSNSHVGQTTPSFFQVGLPNDSLPVGSERLTLDSLVVQYLKHQHRQCPAPISTLPPLSLLNPHVCPEPRRSIDAPSNVTSRLGTREFRSKYGGVHGNRRDRQFVYSRFRPWRTCRDDGSALLTCITFLGNSLQIAVGSHSGELKIFDSNSNNLLDSCSSHQSPLTLVQSHLSSERQLVLSSSPHDVRLWEVPGVSAGPMHSFEGCKAARFSNYGTVFAALSSDSSQREILLYDIQTCNLDLKLTDTSSTNSSGKGLGYSFIHFSPSDTMILWNGVLWDRRGSGPIHQFDQFTDYGGGGFHPSGNEVIINSEVWDLRKFRLLRSVPSLDQTAITFNAHGDVIYAILRRNLDDITSAVNTRRVKHSLFSAFRTVDAINYSDIATTPVDRCVLDFATEQTDSFIGLVTMDDQEEMFSSARIYEIGRRRPTDDDSDPDNAESEDEEDDDEDVDEDPLLGPDIDGDSDDDLSVDDDSISELEDEDDDDGDFVIDGVDFGEGAGILEIVTEGDDDDDSQLAESFSSEDEDFVAF